MKAEIPRAVLDNFQITAGNVCRYAYPLVLYMHQIQPDYIIALDSGARITGFVVQQLYTRIYGSLPTGDSSIHFRKVSHFSPLGFNMKQLKGDVERMMSIKDSPLLFVIDDWINTGMTRQMVTKVISDLSESKIRVRYGVMRELLAGKADVSGAKFCLARTAWRDNENLIGVHYEEGKPYRAKSTEAVDLRRQLTANVRKFVEELDKE